MQDEIDLDDSWIQKALDKKEEIKKGHSKIEKEKCPYCGKGYNNLSRHLEKCPKGPKSKTSESYTIESKIKELEKEVKARRLALDEAKDTIKALVQVVRTLQHHELTEENIIDYFRTVKYAKKYELYRSFTPHDTREIDKIVNRLYKEGSLSRNRNYWYRLNPKFKSKEINHAKSK